MSSRSGHSLSAQSTYFDFSTVENDKIVATRLFFIRNLDQAIELKVLISHEIVSILVLKVS